MERPFYNSFAWVYDRIIEAPFEQRCDFIESIMSDFEIEPGACILDAGCGTGGYAIELANRGYNVRGIDLSSFQIAQADKKIAGKKLTVNFKVADFLNLTDKNKYDLILCRGVLNDLIDDQSRQKALNVFRKTLTEDGVLIFDVRHWERSAKVKTRSPIIERNLQTERGCLKFRSECRLDHENKLLLIHERHCLVTDDKTDTADYDLVMRCWTKQELEERLREAHFQIDALYGDYDRSVPSNASEKMVVIAKPGQ